MLTEKDFKNLQCASSTRFEHIVEKAIPLSCGHLICSNCIDLTKSPSIKCGLCECTSDGAGISNLKPIKFIEKLIYLNLKQISEFVLLKMKKLDETLNVKSDELNNKIENHCEFVESEIDAYIESLKYKLDKYGDKLKQQLKKMKIKLNDNLHLSQSKIEEFQNDIKHFSNEINSFNLDLKTVYSYNSKLKSLNEHDVMENFNFKIKFFPKDDTLLHKSSVGHIVCNYVDESQLKYLSSWCENAKVDFHHLNYRPVKLIKTQISQILVQPSEMNCLNLYDSNFNLLKKIETINNEVISEFRGLDYDARNDTILISSSDHKLYKLKSNFELIQVLFDNQKNFDFIYNHNGKIYVNDRHNKCIYTILFETLQVIETWNLEHSPGHLSIIEDVVCVSCVEGDNNNLCFYSLATHEILYKYPHVASCGIMTYEKWFLIYLHSNWFILDKDEKYMGTARKIYIDSYNCIVSFFKSSENIIYLCIGNAIGKTKIQQ